MSQNRYIGEYPVYTASEKNRHLQSADGVHFTELGYRVLANEVLRELKGLI